MKCNKRKKEKKFTTGDRSRTRDFLFSRIATIDSVCITTTIYPVIVWYARSPIYITSVVRTWGIG